MAKKASVSNWTDRHRKRGRIRKNLLVRMHGEVCAYCDVTGPDCIFDFHHVDEVKYRKHRPIGWRIRQASEADFKNNLIPEVMEACIMLCANCHRIETFA